MTLTITLTDKLEEQLEQEAQRLSLSIEQYSAQVLIQHLEETRKHQAAVNILESWLSGDAVEQTTTGDEFAPLLDEDRLFARTLYSSEGD